MTIGPNVVVGAGARIKDAIILDDSEVRDHACVLNAIIGWRSHVGVWTRIEGSATPSFEAAVNESFNSPTISILGEDVFVADEVVVRNCVVLPHKEIKSSTVGEVIM